MKKEERASLSVSKETRERFMTYLSMLIGERMQLLTQDEGVRELLDCGEKALQKERELKNEFRLYPEHILEKQEEEKRKLIDKMER